jgi:metallo-beta-lactamase family protein
MRSRQLRNIVLIVIASAAVVFLVRGLLFREGAVPSLVFIGGAGEVGGSCLLVDAGGHRFLVDVGSRWEQEDPSPPIDVSFIIITHAHLDHCGALPALFAAGFRGRVYCTPPTADLVPIMLEMASGFVRDEADRDAFENALSSIVPVPFDSTVCSGAVSFTLRRAGHLLGAAFAEIEIGGARGDTRIVVTGDIGSGGSLLIPPPDRCARADYVVMESTYGGVTREGSGLAPEERYAPFGRMVGEAIERGGDVLIPAFALGRTQEVAAAIELFRRSAVIPSKTLVYIDSPSAQRIMEVYRTHAGALSPWANSFFDGNILEYPALREVRSRTSLRVHDRRHEPSVFISSSGNINYANSPRHLMRMCADRRNLCCIVGYQAPGSTGARLLSGETPLLVRCREGGAVREEWITPLIEVRGFESFSGHGDQRDLLEWLRGIGGVEKVFLVHGEPEQSAALAMRIERELRIATVIPEGGDTARLGAH